MVPWSQGSHTIESSQSLVTVHLVRVLTMARVHNTDKRVYVRQVKGNGPGGHNRVQISIYLYYHNTVYSSKHNPTILEE
jgi:hypothetical protein